MDEPSVLDYLKSLLDPRRERIQIPPAKGGNGEEPATHASPDSAPAGRQEAVSRVKAAPLAPLSPPPESGPVPPPTLESEPKPALEPRPLPPLREWPWRSSAALLLALAAQLAFEPPVRLLNRGVVLYILAAGFLGWAIFAREWRIPALPRVRQEADPLTVNRTALGVGIVFVLLAFFSLGGNRFTAFNVVLWVLSNIYMVLAFWLPGADKQPWFTRLRNFVSRSAYQFKLNPWVLAVLGALVLVLFFRFFRLDQVPPEMFSDHAEKLLDVKDVLNGETRIFFPRNTGREAFQMYLTAFTARYLGYGLTFMALKMGTALAGFFTLPFIYLLGVELANRRVGLLAAIFSGISYWLNVITRVALRFSLYPLFAAPTLYYLARGLRRRNRNDFIWAGVFLGLGLHGYSPFRLVPLMVVILIGLYLLHHRNASQVRRAVWNLSIVVIVSFVLFLPLVRYIVEAPENRELFAFRTLTRMGTVERDYPAPVGQIFLGNLWNATTMFAWDNGVTWVHSVTSRPALDVVSAALFHLGVLLLLVRYIRKRHWEDSFSLLSVPLLLMPSVLSLAFPVENPSLNRTAGAIIPVFIIVAIALDGLVNSFKERLGPGTGGRIGWGVAAFLLLWSSFNNYDLIFNQYFRQFQAASWNTTELGAVIRGFADSVGSEESAWVIPWPHWVDTRLVGINAGVPIKDYAISRDKLGDTFAVPGPKLFLFKPEDIETQEVLMSLYPQGALSTFQSKVPTKDFKVYLVVPEDPSPQPLDSQNTLPGGAADPGSTPYP